MTSLALHPVLREFFRALVDLMNLLFLAKQMRWQLEDPRALIRGGTIATERLEKVLKKGSAAALAALLRSQPGLGDLPAVPDNLEQFLLCRLTRQVRRLGRDPLGIGRILDYLWGCSVEARNASLVHHGAALGDSALAAELIG
ncbi:MAG TPA: V-type ATPase subunit [Geomonas sp.]